MFDVTMITVKSTSWTEVRIMDIKLNKNMIKYVRIMSINMGLFLSVIQTTYLHPSHPLLKEMAFASANNFFRSS